MSWFDNIRKSLAWLVYRPVFDMNNWLRSDLVELKEFYHIHVSPYEQVYNDKYPKVDIRHRGRPIGDDVIDIDVRNFFTLRDSTVSAVAGDICLLGDDNSKALACLNWVISNIRYEKEDREYWRFPFETLHFGRGDCEDMAILTANLMMMSMIPYWKIRLTACEVDDGQGNTGGHCMVTFFDEPGERWVLLDACYYQNRKEIKDRIEYKLEPFYKQTYFSWNSRYCFFKTDVRDIGCGS